MAERSPLGFEQSLDFRGSDGRYELVVDKSWEANPGVVYGGFSVGILVRVAGLECSAGRPASVACQFLRPLLVDEPVAVEAHQLRKGRSSELFRVSLIQAGKLCIEGLIRTTSATDGPTCPPQHSFDHGDPLSLRPTLDYIRDDGWKRDPVLYDHVEIRGDGSSPGSDHLVWTRFLDGAVYDDPFLEAARVAFALDNQSPAFLQRYGYVWGPKRRELAWRFTNLDMLVHFHRSQGTEWLCSVSDVIDGVDGIASAKTQVWSQTGELLATGLSQIAFSPRAG
jgi:acyl-CoA thioesterase